MPLLSNPNISLSTSRIESARCVIVPFSTDGRVDIREFQEEFCKANKSLYVSPILPTYQQELEYVKNEEEKIARGEAFENMILAR
jgi:hypothetical protein